MEILYIILWVSNLISLARGTGCIYPGLPSYSKAITQSENSYAVDSHFYYQCADGYHFKESGTERHKVVCTNSGRWQPTFWKCMDDCGNACVHGNCVKTIGPKPGETISKCHCDRNFSGEKCDARVCETHINPPHLSVVKIKGQESGGKYSVGSQINYRCEEGYQIKPEKSHAECTTNGWIRIPPQIPECEEKMCPTMDFSHGTFSPEKYQYKPGEAVTFSCSPRYKLRGENHLKCAKGGKWIPSNDWPKCEAYACLQPSEVRYASFRSSSSYAVGTHVTYTCINHYWMDGDATVRCNEGKYNGQPWWGVSPHCYSSKECRLRNKEVTEKDGKLVCIEDRHDGGSRGGSRVVTSTVSSTVKPLTIVTATAGALLLLLLIVISLVAYQRRRIAINNRRLGRERFHNEEDRFSFVYYSNDVHVVLPSYDEAMRVQGAPPAYPSDGTAVNTTLTENVNEVVGRGEAAASLVPNQLDITEVTDDTEISSNYGEGQIIANEPRLIINTCRGITASGITASPNISNEHSDNPGEIPGLKDSNKEEDSELGSDNIFDDDTIPLFVDEPN